MTKKGGIMTNKQVALITILAAIVFILLIYSILMTIMCDDLIRNIKLVCMFESVGLNERYR